MDGNIKVPAFHGFSEDAFKFFKGLRKNNTREWFQPRKEIYETQVRAVMEDLAGDLNHEFAKFAPLYITEPKKAVFRIYRDTRFSKNKTPYKTHVAASFSRQGMEKLAAAGYYVSVSDTEIEIGGGLYMSETAALRAVRTHIADSHDRFAKIVGNKKLVASMGTLHGDALTRVPKGFDPDHECAAWLRMKQWLFFKTLDGGEWMRKPALFKEVATSFQLIAPLIEFLNEPLVKAARKPSAAEMMF